MPRLCVAALDSYSLQQPHPPITSQPPQRTKARQAFQHSCIRLWRPQREQHSSSNNSRSNHSWPVQESVRATATSRKAQPVGRYVMAVCSARMR